MLLYSCWKGALYTLQNSRRWQLWSLFYCFIIYHAFSIPEHKIKCGSPAVHCVSTSSVPFLRSLSLFLSQALFLSWGINFVFWVLHSAMFGYDCSYYSNTPAYISIRHTFTVFSRVLTEPQLHQRAAGHWFWSSICELFIGKHRICNTL